eukprot:GHVS01035425.1.p1 GENE.GHVS01035425.1~~GHVS01035425.1.p1  ORF type:complete len:304 (+),score=28.81 GHVS01035425.1:255-1166(+)
MDTSQLLASSTLSGFLVGCICTPFDVVKNYWQFNPSLAHRRTSISSRQVLSHVYRSGGISTFWTGLGPALGVIVPANIIFFGLYERLKKDNTSAALAGMQARSCAVAVVAPVEFLRTKLQADIGGMSARELLRFTLNNEGLGSLWRGLLPTLLRDVPFSAIYWELNERMKGAVKRYDYNYDHRPRLVSSFMYPFLTGGASAGIACVLTHPCDIIKTNLQASNRLRVVRGDNRLSPPLRTVEVIRDLWRREGLRAFGVGLAPRLGKIIPSCAVLLSTYELSTHMATSSAATASATVYDRYVVDD